MEKKVLRLTVSKEWYDKILSGEKTEEYRDIKPYWVNRLIEIPHKQVGTDTVTVAIQYNIIRDREEVLRQHGRRFTHVLFFNGYGKNRPHIEKEIVSITISKPKKGLCPDEWLDKEFFVIKFK